MMFDIEIAEGLCTNYGCINILNTIFKNTDLTVEQVTLRNRSQGINFRINNFMKIVINGNLHDTYEERERDNDIKRLVGRNCSKHLVSYIQQSMDKYDKHFWSVGYDESTGCFSCVLTTDGNFVSTGFVNNIKELYKTI